MKKDIHPKDFRPVVFSDTSSDFSFLTRSTAASEESIKWADGQQYPLVKIHISSASHPFYTGKDKMVDIEGRVDKFRARADRAKAHRAGKAKGKSPVKISKPTANIQKLGAVPTPGKTKSVKS